MDYDSKEENRLPQLGLINYVNSLPIVLPLVQNMIALKAKVQYGSPNELNEGYRKGSLDLGAMSAFFYLQEGSLTLIPNLSISSNGPVGSVLFFLKSDIDSLKKQGNSIKVAVPLASATSVNLLNVLLQEEFGLIPQIFPSAKPVLAEDKIDGALIIGDLALDLDTTWSKSAKRFDLGEWWHKRFNLPMVFAVWAARKSWLTNHKNEFEEIAFGLQKSCQIGLNQAFDQIIAQACQQTGLSPDRMVRYFKNELDFSFSLDHQNSLSKYKSLCEKYGLLNLALSNPA